jgi:uncharacterized membrane protein YecN with MAPEG domain
MALVNLVIALALMEFFGFGAAVGKARDKYHVAAPATTGHEIFERYFRVQMNTLELLIMFIPAIWIFAHYISPGIAAALGALFLIGRIVYFLAYVKEPKSRKAGFALSAGPLLVLVIGAVFGAARSALLHL